MKNIMKLYNDYAKTYDLKCKDIMRKFHHSYRVMEFACEIAKSLNMSERDIYVVSIAGLFHDVARFMQWTDFKTYIDGNSFDHGDMGYEITKELFIDKFDLTEVEKEVVLKTIRNHNKYSVNEKLTKQELVVINIIRDADKLDIIKEQGFLTKNEEVKEELIGLLKEHKMIPNDMVITDMDSLFRLIAFIFDLNYTYSINYLLHKKIIENKINLIEIYGNVELDELQENLINYMKGRLKC